MAKFRYRMQNILNIKEKLEMQAKNEFAAANMELLEEQERRKTQEVLRDKAFEVFQQEEKAEEGKQIDQLTSYTYGQKAKKEESR